MPSITSCLSHQPPSPQSWLHLATWPKGGHPLKQMIFVFNMTAETGGRGKKVFQMPWGCQISDQKLLKEKAYTRISCFIIYLCVCFPSQHQQYSFSIFGLWCVGQFFFNMHYDLAMSKAQLQWQWKHFGDGAFFPLIANGSESWGFGLCCLTVKTVFDTNVPH